MTENKLCPFCGSEMEIGTSWYGTENDITYEYAPQCNNEKCIARNAEGEEFGHFLFDYPTPEEAAAAWNTRPLEDELTARIAELEAEVKELKNEWHQPEELPIEDGWYLVEWDDYGKLEWVPMFWFVGWNEADYTHYYGKIKRWRKLPKS
jgi:hypothetical protein